VLFNLTARQDFARNNPETIKKVLHALIEARSFIMEYPEKAGSIVGGYLRMDAVSLSEYNFDVRLSTTLLISLETQARWAIRNHLTERQTVPNFLGLIYAQGLEAVAPDTVALVHPGERS
jgi:NitT/TauT family transport system substrate-binding protein